jgi:hypothetical protein
MAITVSASGNSYGLGARIAGVAPGLSARIQRLAGSDRITRKITEGTGTGDLVGITGEGQITSADATPCMPDLSGLPMLSGLSIAWLITMLWPVSCSSVSG